MKMPMMEPIFFICETKTLTKGGIAPKSKLKGLGKVLGKREIREFFKPLSLQETGTPCSYLSSLLKEETSNIWNESMILEERVQHRGLCSLEALPVPGLLLWILKGTRQVADWLRAPAAFVEDPGSFLNAT